MDNVIFVPTVQQDLDHVRRLMRAFIAWHKDRHRDDLTLIDAYFDEGAFENELATLPGKYLPPDGQLLLATLGGAPAGCVALRRIDAEHCEMKRMFVYPQLQGKGVGSSLVEAIVHHARQLGYTKMRLDTSVRQEEAQRLYGRHGFSPIQPYYEVSDELRNWLVFMERRI